MTARFREEEKNNVLKAKRRTKVGEKKKKVGVNQLVEKHVPTVLSGDALRNLNYGFLYMQVRST